MRDMPRQDGGGGWWSWKRKRGKGKKVADVKGKEKEKEEEVIQTGNCGPARDPHVSKIYQLPYKEVTICKVGEGDCNQEQWGNQRFQALALLHLTGGGRGLYCQFVWGCQFVCIPCKTYYPHAKRYLVGMHRIWEDMVKSSPKLKKEYIWGNIMILA